MYTLSRVYGWRGYRGLSDNNGLQRFWRGFTRGFYLFCRGFDQVTV
jgi:hypothetical protein